MKQKEGRDWLNLSQSIFTPDGEDFRISDSCASIYLTQEDIERIVKLVHKIKEKDK